MINIYMISKFNYFVIESLIKLQCFAEHGKRQFKLTMIKTNQLLFLIKYFERVSRIQ